jgi:hypothetical protein
MAKNKTILPKKVAGFKVPKRLRKSRLLGSLLASPLGRQIVADALTAGAAAAAATLVQKREEVGDTAEAGVRKGARTMAVLTEAVENAADAVVGVVADAARSMATGDGKKGKSRRPAEAGATRH